jgi:hypothetical protein
MRANLPQGVLLYFGGALLLLAGPGCYRSRGHERFIPSAAAAQQALDAYLTAWQAGRQDQVITADAVTVQAGDSLRQPGRKLAGYTILGEAPGDSPRCFSVRLKLENPNEEQKARYVVFGANPYWVLRHEDLQMLAHWEMDGDAPKKTPLRK